MAIWKIRERKKKKWPRRLRLAGIVLAVFTLLGFFAVPPILKAQLEKRASALLGRTVTVSKVRFNPYTVAVTLEGLDVRLKDGTGSFLGWDRLYVNADPLASLFGAWSLGAVELDGFHATVQLKPDGSFNFSDILAQLNPPGAPAAPAPAKPGRPLYLGSLKVNGARVDFTDQSRSQAFTTTLGPVTFALTEFRTTGSRGAPFHFEAVSEAGEKFAWTGTLTAEPFGSKGELKLDNIVLRKYLAYYADQLKGDLREGKLSLQARYDVNLTEGARVLRLTDGAVQLRGLKLTAPGDTEPAISLTALDVSAINADGVARKATVGAVSLSGGQIRVVRAADGALNLVTMFEPNTPATVTAPATPPPATPAKLPEFLIGEVALKDFAVEVSDQAAPRPAQLGLRGISASLKNVTLADGAVMPLTLAMNWAPRGAIDVQGTVGLKPTLKAELKTDVTGLDLLPLSPYLEQFLNARIAQGAVSTKGSVQVALAGDTPAISFDGGVTLEKLGLVDGVHSEDLAGLGELALTGLKVATLPQLTVALDEITVAAPYARVVVNADKSLNLAGLAKATPAAAPAPLALATTQAPLPKITVGKVVIRDGEFTLADRSLQPNVRMAINQFGGTIAGLSSENFAKADVDLKAAVDGAGPITITGRLDPLGVKKFVDLKVDFKNVDLVPLSPYSGKFAGYELARGKLTLDVTAKLDGKQLEAANVITLQQFTFGTPVQSPDATKLPVRLGVALLKDLDGKIVIDVPVSGNLEDPSFGVGRVVLRVIVNLLTKAAVSPFALLGSMFGGGGDELAYQDFTAGGTELQAAEIKKLETMVKALANRPGLSVAIEGAFDGPADTYALQHQKVAALVRGKIWEERHALNPNIAPPEQLEITPEAAAAMVKKLFDAQFPPGTQFGAPLAAAPEAAAAPTAEQKSLIRRVVDVITFRSTSKPKPVAPAPVVNPAAAPVGPTLEEMTGRLAEAMPVDENDLRALAAARAARVRDYFLNEGKVAPDRLFLNQGSAAKGPRVFLSLQ